MGSERPKWTVGRRGKDITIPDGDVSTDHGQFAFDGAKWVYRLDPKPPLNGSWKGVSNFEMFHQGKISPGMVLRDDDMILIGQQHLKFQIDQAIVPHQQPQIAAPAPPQAQVGIPIQGKTVTNNQVAPIHEAKGQAALPTPAWETNQQQTVPVVKESSCCVIF